jgi:hypothetical protein
MKKYEKKISEKYQSEMKEKYRHQRKKGNMKAKKISQ